MLWLTIPVLFSTETSGVVLTSPQKHVFFFFATTKMAENWAEDSLKISIGVTLTYDVVLKCSHCLHSQSGAINDPTEDCSNCVWTIVRTVDDFPWFHGLVTINSPTSTFICGSSIP